MDLLDVELRIALGSAAHAELRTQLEVPVNQAAGPVWAALRAALDDWTVAFPESLRSEVELGVCQAVPAAVETIHRHDNSEVRRAAIERMGWLTYGSAAGLRLVASAPDPGNPPPSAGAVLRPRGTPRRRPGSW